MTRRRLVAIQQHVDRLPRPRTLRDIVRRCDLEEALVRGILRAERRESERSVP